MIAGVGVDIIEIDRIKKSVERNPKFVSKVFTKNEIEYLESRKMRPEYIAGRFAAKEAISKALGTGIRGFDLKDIEIDRNSLGKPIAVLRGKCKKILKKYSSYKIHISISHSKENAIAYALLEVEENDSFEI
ncbi:holo-ACP synthase [Clostridium grantii]|uniref:Holo-[acyl-carrier-protein] synthase n=1 Tax=Clostridium grantii DSM 8605 TaxID=1121316 RepID=A0A1M5U470_9CLOT|nr:holo-ACP synthase [Clostridium grantii]SHH57822.1 holo-[acyl-carrier-protein] synthase [Clostridium grantii DSM 8605]